MQSKITSFTVYLLLPTLFFIIPRVESEAQPTEPVSCHQVKQRIASHPATPQERRRAQAGLKRSDTIDVLHYEINLDVTRFSQKELYATTDVVFTPKMPDVDTLNLDLEGLTVDSVYTGNKSLDYSYNDLLLSVVLPEPLSSNDTMRVSVDYHGTPITCPSGFGGFYFEEGYAYNLGIALQDEPHNYGRSWYPCFDNFVERSTYEYRVLSNQNRRAYCVGQLTEEQQIGQDSVLRVFEMNQPIPTYLSHAAISNYTAVHQTHSGQYGETPIRLVSRPGDTSNFKSSFSALGEAIDCLESWYGPYAFHRVGFNLTPRGAMEHPTAVAFPESGIANGTRNLDLMAHELTHHWWGNLTTLETSADMWIKEGPSDYGEHLLREYLNGPEALADAVRNNNHYVIENAHLDDGQYLALSPMPKNITYGTHTYQRGAVVIHNLRTYLGDSLFREGMQHLLEQRAFDAVDAESFRLLLEEGSGMSLKNFFDDWVYAPGWSDFEIDSLRVLNEGATSTTVRLSIEQKLHHAPELHEDVPLRIAFFAEDFERVERRIRLDGQYSEVEVELPFTPVQWYVNPGQALNIASFNSRRIIRKAKEYNFDYDDLNTTVHSVSDSAMVAIEHHYSAPDAPDSGMGEYRFSTTHFWEVKIYPAEKINMQATYRYEGGNESDFEAELTAESEDSLVLMYRPSAGANWTEYPNYRKIIFAAGDGNGFINIDSLQSGQYALANEQNLVAADRPSRNIQDLKIYPNPTSGEVFLEWPDEMNSTTAKVSIFDHSGQLVHRESLMKKKSLELPAHSWQAGVYYVSFEGTDGKMAGGTFVKE